jgi:hypothetical protein
MKSRRNLYADYFCKEDDTDNRPRKIPTTSSVMSKDTTTSPSAPSTISNPSQTVGGKQANGKRKRDPEKKSDVVSPSSIVPLPACYIELQKWFRKSRGSDVALAMFTSMLAGWEKRKRTGKTFKGTLPDLSAFGMSIKNKKSDGSSYYVQDITPNLELLRDIDVIFFLYFNPGNHWLFEEAVGAEDVPCRALMDARREVTKYMLWFTETQGHEEKTLLDPSLDLLSALYSGTGDGTSTEKKTVEMVKIDLEATSHFQPNKMYNNPEAAMKIHKKATSRLQKPKKLEDICGILARKSVKSHRVPIDIVKRHYVNICLLSAALPIVHVPLLERSVRFLKKISEGKDAYERFKTQSCVKSAVRLMAILFFKKEHDTALIERLVTDAGGKFVDSR